MIYINRLVAKIYVETAVYHIDRAFDYLVPEEMSESLKIGCRVIVPFGAANKKVQGIVSGIEPAGGITGKLKSIFSLLDEEPPLSEELFGIAEFLSRSSFCTFYDAVKCVLPIGKNVEIVRLYRAKDSVFGEILEGLSAEQRRILEFLQIPKTTRELNEFLEYRQNPEKQADIKRLLSQNMIEKIDKQVLKVKEKLIKMVKPSEDFDESVKLSPKQQEVMRILREVSFAAPKELAYLSGVTVAVVTALIKKGAISEFMQKSVRHYGEIEPEFERLENVKLSEEQQTVCGGIDLMIKENRPNAALLHGVTGSGKTQIYIKLIENTLKINKTAILLVPEIALTPQMLAKFQGLFGEIIAVIHSGISPAERMREYERIKAKQAKIVIGTRSAVFAPLENIGIIIMDEEGESSYKSESPPRYHARDVAKKRCAYHNATLLLGSATPSIDSYYNAQTGKYKLFTLESRYADADLPDVFLVDMLAEIKMGNASPISEVLGEQLIKNIEKSEQSILLINRRGHSTFAACMDCGEVMKCPSCDVSMTYHRANGCMMCHYCGHSEKFVSKCQSCGSDYIKLTGVGTQKLEDALRERMPAARILRMDADTTYGKDSYETAFADFKDGKYDIMLGTQMIAKGLDFPNVTLVGVLNAEGGLYSTDFRASERVFSLITQVVGRSGRSGKRGRAYVQTLDAENPIVNFAANQDYKAFYEEEIFVRQEMLTPPFCDIVVLGFSGENENAVEAAACKATEILREAAEGREKIALKVYGAARAAVYKISNKYRYRVLVKCRLNRTMQEVIAETLKKCGEDKGFNGISCYADVNGTI